MNKIGLTKITSPNRLHLSRWSLSVWSSLLLVAMTCHAQDLIVDCSGQDPNAFHRIQDALQNIPFTPWQVVIQVTGTCQENVYLGHMRNLTIAAPLGQTATIQGDGVSYA